MNGRGMGLLGLMLSALTLSLELSLLKLIQMLERTTGSWHENIWVYVKAFPMNLALALTLAVMVGSALLAGWGGRVKR